MSRLCLLLCLTLSLVLTGCLPNQMLTRSGALNTMSIDLNDDNVAYEQLSNSFDMSSFAGFLDTQPDGNFQSKSSTVINNNGIQTRTAVTRQGTLLKFMTLLSSSLQISALAFESFPDVENRIGLVIPSLLVSIPLNEGLWRPFNRRQVQGMTMNRLIGRNPDAHFYSFPNSNISETAGLFGTSWAGQNYIVAGTISDSLVRGAGSVALPQRSALDAYNQMRESRVPTAASNNGEALSGAEASSSNPVSFRFGTDISQLVSTDGQDLVAYDYLRHAGIRVGIGAILDSREGLQFLPELCFTTKHKT